MPQTSVRKKTHQVRPRHSKAYHLLGLQRAAESPFFPLLVLFVLCVLLQISETLRQTPFISLLSWSAQNSYKSSWASCHDCTPQLTSCSVHLLSALSIYMQKKVTGQPLQQLWSPLLPGRKFRSVEAAEVAKARQLSRHFVWIARATYTDLSLSLLLLLPLWHRPVCLPIYTLTRKAQKMYTKKQRNWKAALTKNDAFKRRELEFVENIADASPVLIPACRSRTCQVKWGLQTWPEVSLKAHK